MKWHVAIFRAEAAAALEGGFKALKKKELHLWLLASLTVKVCVWVVHVSPQCDKCAWVCVCARLPEQEQASVAYH